MQASVTLAYGKRAYSFKTSTAPDIYAVDDPKRRIDETRFAERLASYLSQAELDLASPAVVVADKTRLCGYSRFLPVLLDTLCRFGAEPQGITLWVAYGTHGRQTEAESQAAYGPAYGMYRWIHHRCDGGHFVRLATTRRGTPVYLPKDLMAATSIITFGAISHHYFAGFGGGRKLLFPGLGKRTAVYANHGLYLDLLNRRLADGCQPGLLDGNPLAEDLAEIEAQHPAHMAIHGILDSGGHVADLLVGQGGQALFRQACAAHAAQSEIEPRRRYDLVLASAGGYPKDINFIQSHKAIHHAAALVADGGQLVVLAECCDGIGSDTFLPWFNLGGWDAAFDRLAAVYAGNGGTALAMMDKTRRIRISMVTELDPRILESIGVEPWSLDRLKGCLAANKAPWAMIPNASMVVCKPAGYS